MSSAELTEQIAYDRLLQREAAEAEVEAEREALKQELAAKAAAGLQDVKAKFRAQRR